MFGISFAELMIIFLLILVVMGPEKLPEVARWAGKGLREVRKATNTLRSALAMDELEDLRSMKNFGVEEPGPTVSGKANPEAPKSTSKWAPKAGPKKALPGESPGEPSLPSNLDQVDPEQFDQMLQRQYQIRRTELRSVDLPLARSTEEVSVVFIQGADKESGQRFDIPLSTPPAAEIA